MLICDHCQNEGGSRYRLTVGAYGGPGQDFAEIDLCPECAQECFGDVFLLVREFGATLTPTPQNQKQSGKKVKK